MKENIKKALLWVLDLVINVAIIFGIVMVIQTWIVAPFDVSGASMCNTLNNMEGECHNGYGEKILINEALYLFNDPERGDIVVFKSPNDEEKYFIKRVIGLPGDKVEIKNGEIYITEKGKEDEIRVDEEYLSDENRGQTKTYFSDFSTFTVPEGKYFMLGDNRKASTDSRSCFESSISLTCKDNPERAYIDRDSIRGKAWVVWWPVTSMRLIDHPEYNELK